MNSSSNPDTTITNFLCKFFPKNVSNNDNGILCDLSYSEYKYLQTCNEPWSCLSCFPLGTIKHL